MRPDGTSLEHRERRGADDQVGTGHGQAHAWDDRIGALDIEEGIELGLSQVCRGKFGGGHDALQVHIYYTPHVDGDRLQADIYGELEAIGGYHRIVRASTPPGGLVGSGEYLGWVKCGVAKSGGTIGLKGTGRCQLCGAARERRECDLAQERVRGLEVERGQLGDGGSRISDGLACEGLDYQRQIRAAGGIKNALANGACRIRKMGGELCGGPDIARGGKR